MGSPQGEALSRPVGTDGGFRGCPPEFTHPPLLSLGEGDRGGEVNSLEGTP